MQSAVRSSKTISILGIYRRLLAENQKPVVPLAIRMVNEIPLAMVDMMKSSNRA